MTEKNIYIEQRLQKVNELRAKGLNPYTNSFVPDSLCKKIIDLYKDTEQEKLEALSNKFSLAGRVMANRSFGKAGFIQLRDRSGQLQVFCQKSILNDEDFEIYKNIDMGDFVFVQGPLFRTKTNELTLKAEVLKNVTKSIRPLPEKWHGLTDVETRYRQRYVDLIANPSVCETFIQRSKIISQIRDFLLQRDFLEVETPMMHPIPGGASAKPFVTHHNTLDLDLYLRIAPELYLKRLVVGGLERVFEINRNFRNEGVSIQHNPEFTMLEFYQSYSTYEDLMTLTEEMMSSLVKKVSGSFHIEYQGTSLDFTPPFRRLSIFDALVNEGGISPQNAKDAKFLETLCRRYGIIERGHAGGLGLYQTLLFEHLVESKLIQPTFVTKFPMEVSPLARCNDQNPEVVDRFELMIFGREIANGFSELNDPVDQAERFQNQVKARDAGDEEAMYYDADYVRALEYGMPPTAGEGIGIDRLVMLLTNSPSIRDVILFPQLRPER